MGRSQDRPIVVLVGSTEGLAPHLDGAAELFNKINTLQAAMERQGVTPDRPQGQLTARPQGAASSKE
jgi:hypothetical protein